MSLKIRNVHVRRETREAAPSTAAEAEQQRVAERLSNHAADAADVNQCVREDDEFGSRRVDLQEVLEVVLHHLLQTTRLQIGELHILLVLHVRDSVDAKATRIIDYQ